MNAIVLRSILSWFCDNFRGRAVLQLELLALRHQLATVKRNSARPSLRLTDRLLWIVLSRILPSWRDVLVIVKPETVVGWHRKGFRLYWTWRSRPRRRGRPPVPREVLMGKVGRIDGLYCLLTERFDRSSVYLG